MGYNIFENVAYCKEIVDSYLVLLYYTHIPPTLIALMLGIYVFLRNRKSLSAKLLLALSVVYGLWTTADLLIWLTYDQATPMMFLWSVIGLLSSLLFVLTFLFIYVFVTGRSIPRSLLLVIGALLLPVILLTPTAYNLEGFYIRDCIALEGTWFLYYYHAIGLLVALALPFIPLFRKRDTEGSRLLPKAAVAFAIIGAELFVLTFLSTSFLASYLVEAGIVPDFGIEQYGILAMAVFMAFLAYLIVQYHAFRIRVLAVQALVLALVILVASEYLFVTTAISYWLVTTTLVLAVFFGIILIRSVKREIEQRERIEALAKELEKANQQQIVLIHFITHQIKGFMTKSRNLFSMLLEGDFGQPPAPMKPMLEEGLKSDTKGVNTIQEILNAANIKSGKVTYAKSSVDFRELVEDIADDLKPTADAKGLTLTFTADEGDHLIQGDRMQLTNAVKNLIDNSIKYTPAGKVSIALTREAGQVRLVIKDTGVGITPEDMKLLFTEGGHGKESQKVNVESTGFGLYIVKNIIEAHHGRVWAESEGSGKGSRFIVELPVA